MIPESLTRFFFFFSPIGITLKSASDLLQGEPGGKVFCILSLMPQKSNALISSNLPWSALVTVPLHIFILKQPISTCMYPMFSPQRSALWLSTCLHGFLSFESLVFLKHQNGAASFVSTAVPKSRRGKMSLVCLVIICCLKYLSDVYSEAKSPKTL